LPLAEGLGKLTPDGVSRSRSNRTTRTCLMRKTTTALSLLALAAITGVASAQAVPTTQPSLIQITREIEKNGRGADHARWEAGWPAAYAKANSPDAYLAFASITGPSEVWYVGSYANNAAIGEGMKRDAANAALSAELDRLRRGDAEFLSDLRTIHAAARTDLSMGAFPDITKMRFWEISTFRVRPGHEPQFEAAAKAYMSAAKRSSPSTNFRTYEVVAGMPSGTYIIFGSVAAFADLDKTAAAGEATFRGATAEEMGALQKFSLEGSLSTETNRYRLDPGQSYVSKEVRASDPAFWMPKKMAAKP
jgi:hypothetical protein